MRQIDHNHHPVRQSPEYLGQLMKRAVLVQERAEREVMRIREEILDLKDHGLLTADQARRIEADAYYGMELQYIESTTTMEIKLGRR